jgi:hypothetical protein
MGLSLAALAHQMYADALMSLVGTIKKVSTS